MCASLCIAGIEGTRRGCLCLLRASGRARGSSACPLGESWVVSVFLWYRASCCLEVKPSSLLMISKCCVCQASVHTLKRHSHARFIHHTAFHWGAQLLLMFFLDLARLLFFFFQNWNIVDLQYYTSYIYTTSWFTIFKDYTPFIVMIEYWQFSLCCAVYPHGTFILYVIVCTS